MFADHSCVVPQRQSGRFVVDAHMSCSNNLLNNLSTNKVKLQTSHMTYQNNIIYRNFVLVEHMRELVREYNHTCAFVCGYSNRTSLLL